MGLRTRKTRAKGNWEKPRSLEGVVYKTARTLVGATKKSHLSKETPGKKRSKRRGKGECGDTESE